VTDPRARGLLDDLEALERWAEHAAQRSHSDPDWRARRLYVQAHRDVQAESYFVALSEIEGAESAYADAAARIAHLRPQLEQAAEAGRGAVEIAVALGGEFAWTEAQRQEALASSGALVDPEELHARGRATALAAIGAELRALIDVASARERSA
jgi:hypothetical protein